MIALSVNLNKVALLRNSRTGTTPSVVTAAETVIAAGCHGITLHPRPDQRHVRPQDIMDIHGLLKSNTDIEFNIEGNPFAGTSDNGYPGFDALIDATAPTQTTLVPDDDSQLTSDHGWDLSGDNARLIESIKKYQATGSRVCLFMDPDLEQISAAQACGADRIELYTGPFADCVLNHGLEDATSLASFSLYLKAAQHANKLGLGVNAGHDLNVFNLSLFCQIEELAEVSIGHALINQALYDGLSDTVHKFLAALNG